MINENKKTPILLIDDDPKRIMVNFTDGLEWEFDVNVFHEDNFENVLEVLDSLKDELQIIILDIMARKHESLYGKSTKQGFNAGLVLLQLIENKLIEEGWRENITIIIRSARQDLDFIRKTLEGTRITIFSREQSTEIKKYIKKILNK
jgi:hypothetical protein